MARRLSSHVLLVLTLVALLLPLSSSPPLQAKQASLPVQAAASSTTSLDSTAVLGQQASIRINEVMPKPEDGDSEWVELYRPRVFLVYLPLVLRNAAGSVADTQVDSLPGNSASLNEQFDISGWQITDEDGNSYTIPDELPEVPRDAYVLVVFDGAGSGEDDYDFGDDVAVLHSTPGLVDIFEDEADQVALYYTSTHNSDAIVDFVAYGAPPDEESTNAFAAGIWLDQWYVSLHIGFGLVLEGTDTVAGLSLGLRPDLANEGPSNWTIYLGEDLSPGAVNPLPRPYASTVADGQEMAADGFALGWSWSPDGTYYFQMDDDPAFDSPLVYEVLNAPWYAPEELLPSGEYFWRVRAIGPGGDLSGWTEPAAISVSGLEEEASGLAQVRSVTEENQVPNIRLLRQRKDTGLLCLDGCNEGDPNEHSLEEAWDSPHPVDDIYEHGSQNCARASIAMIATRYGGHLSQDRIAYEERKDVGGEGPEYDLGHNQETPGYEIQELLAWALGVEEADILHVKGKPTFEEIRGWIDAGRPILRGDSDHATVIAGYRVRWGGIKKEVLLFDPRAGASWPDYNLFFSFKEYWVAPLTAPSVRSDEHEIWADSDDDGIMDWDETTRWKEAYNNLDPSKADTDGDWVPDKSDMREWVFDSSGEWQKFPTVRRNWDGDDFFKEVDPDSDGGGSLDGCEDTDGDGHYEPELGETYNFRSDDDKQCRERLHFLAQLTEEPECGDFICGLLFGFNVIEHILPKPDSCDGEPYPGDPKEIVWYPGQTNVDSNLHVGDTIEVYGNCWLDLGYLPAVGIQPEEPYFLRKVY